MGEAASDLVRAAAAAAAILTYHAESGTAELASQLCSDLLAAPTPGGGGAKRRRAAPEAAVAGPSAGEHASGQGPRSCVRAEVQPRRVDPSADTDADGAYLARRSAEIEAYVAGCKRMDAAKAANN